MAERNGGVMSWKSELAAQLREFESEHATKGKIVSKRTIELRRQLLYRSFGILHDLGYKFEKLSRLKVKHLVALFHHLEDADLSSASLQSYHTTMMFYLRKTNRSNMLSPLDKILKNPDRGRRSYAAKGDKSWDSPNDSEKEGEELLTNSVSDDLIRSIETYDKYVGMQLRVMRAFGLRRKEAICLRPHIAEVNDGNFLQVYQGSKGGRWRLVPILNDEQRMVLDKAKRLVPNHLSHLGSPKRDLEENLRRFKYVLEKFGVTKSGTGFTSHGLRSQYAIKRYREMAKDAPPLLGGSASWFQSIAVKLIRRKVAEELGHSRISVTTAYYGGTRKSKRD